MKKLKSSKSHAAGKIIPQKTQKDFLVVGIGASAGGIKALKEFFQYVPETSGMAYVVILHLSPEFESKLAEVLQVTAQIPVEQVQAIPIKVRPNMVYVISPNKSLTINDGYLKTSPIKNYAERRAPVDVFFRTLAESHESRAVSVILSGTGPNGSMGVKWVKEKGGAIFVQDPDEAEFDDMPLHSIATNLVDAVLPVAGIPAKIISYRDSLDNLPLSLELLTKDEGVEQALLDIFNNLRIRTGHDFTNYKQATILRRIERRIIVHELADVGQYAVFLSENPDETKALLKDLLISVTNFFRDPDVFENLGSEIVPKILEGKRHSDNIRIWVAGCATGEEAYSLAMLFCEHMPDKLDAPKIQIFATDIDESAISAAREGLYSNSDIADISPERLHRFFIQEDENYRVRRELQEMILFANHNVLKDPPFSHLNLISCRNLLIYFNRAAQGKVREIFHFALDPGSYLFLGSSESIDGAGNLFSVISKEKLIYQSRAVKNRTYFPFPESSSGLLSPPAPQVVIRQTGENKSIEQISNSALHLSLLEYYTPPSIVINEEYDIIHMSEGAARYTQLPGGEPSINLLKVIRPELRLELRTAIYQSVQNRVSIETSLLKVNLGGTYSDRVSIIVRPVLHKEENSDSLLLVIFKPSEEDKNIEALSRIEPINHAEPIARQLEAELQKTKTLLRTTIEQYEVQTEELKASNEELQAMNEETRSSAEELETSKEELQSINEELKTVNQELKIKIEELSLSNNDFQNLMNSTDIGTIFLDRSLRIKIFTPNIQKIFNLIPNDLGRVLTDITGKLDYTDLKADIALVLKKLQSMGREIQTAAGFWYLTRIVPYRTAEDHINGVILTFVDITDQKEAETSIRFQAHLLNIVEQSIIATDLDGKVIYWNKFAEKLFGWSSEEAVGRNITDLTTPDMMIEQAEEIMSLIRDGRSWSGEFQVRRRDGTTFPAHVTDSPIEDDNGNLIGIIGISVNISKRRKIEDALRESEQRLRLVIESAIDFAILTTTPDGLVDTWNIGAEHVFGYPESEIVGRSAAILFTPEDRKKNVPEKEMKTALETGHALDERWHLRRDGSRFFASGVMTPLGNNRGFVKIARDMTERIQAEKFERDREMLQKLVGTQEDERKRIARDLHDHLGQQMTALRLKIEATRNICDNNKELGDKIDEIQLIAKHIDADVDFLAWELRPASLDDLGLPVSLNRYAQEWSLHSGIMAEFHAAGFDNMRLLPEAETNLYRIAQEGFNNIWKHARAKRASILLEKHDDSVVLIIEDNGTGFDVEDKDNRNKGIGLIGMHERAILIGGTLEIESAPNQGTTIFVRVPVELNDGEVQT